MSVLCNNVIAGASIADDASGDGAYQIEKSLRFNPADAPYLNRSVGVAGNRRIWTISFWVKHSEITSEYPTVFSSASAGNTDNHFIIRFEHPNGELKVSENTGGSSSYSLESSAMHRDFSAWYHFVVAFDSTQATSTERVKIYKNGKRITAFNSPSYPAQNYESHWNESSTYADNHVIGREAARSNYETSGYLADVQFIDGLALSPAAFGSFDSTGVWNPKAFALPTINTGTTWSGTTTGADGFVAGAEITKGFDGKLTTYTTGDTSGEAIVLPITTNIVKGGVRVFGGWTGSYPGTIKLYNGSTLVEEFKSIVSGEQWISSSTYSGNITSIDISRWGTKPTFHAIEIHGVTLVDGRTDPTTRTNQNNGTAWSSVGTASNWDSSANYGINKAFQGYTVKAPGATGVSGGDGATSTDTNVATYDLGSSNKITGITNLQVFVNTHTDHHSGTNNVKINDTDISTQLLAQNTANKWGWVDLGTTFTEFQKIEVKNWFYTVGGIKVNGYILGDSIVDNSFHLKFNDTSSNAALGADYLGTETIRKPGGFNADANSAKLVLAVPGDVTTDVSPSIRGSGSAKSAAAGAGTLAAVSTDQSKFYGSSIKVETDKQVQYTDSTDFDFDTGDCTVEAWVRSTSNSLTLNTPLDLRSSGINGPAIFFTNGNAWQVDCTGTSPVSSGTGTAAVNTWYHIALSRASGSLRFFVDGQQIGTTASNTSDWSSGKVTIGHESNQWDFQGFVNDLRVYKGVGKYTANFTPPTRNDFTVNNLEATTYSTFAPAGPIYKTADKDDGFSDDSLKEYLRFACPCNDGDDNLDMNDYHATIKGSGSNHSITATGYVSDSPSSDTGWGYSARSDSNQATAQSSDFELTSSDDFCLEFWTYIFNNNSNPLTTHARIFNFGDDSVNNIGFAVYTNGNIYPMILGDYIVTGGSATYYTDTNILNAWYHWAVTRENGVVRIFGNGALKAQEANTGAMGSSYNTMRIGGANHLTNVKYHDIRYYIGTPKYTAAFTPSRAIGQVVQDSLTDSPTNYGTESDPAVGGEARGNYCTFNPLGSVLTYASFSNGNLDHVGSNNGSHFSFATGTLAFNSADTDGFYFEVEQTVYGQHSTIGLHDVAYQLAAADTGGAIGSGATNGPMGITYNNQGTVYNFGTDISSQPTYTAAGDVIGIAVKEDKVWFAKNNSWISGNPSTGASPTATLSTSKYLSPCITGYSSGEFSLNTGQRAFKYTAPSGFKALCTQNLDDTFSGAELNNPSKYFDVKTYTGTGSSHALTGLNFGPDLVWIKKRNATSDHALFDQVRGVHERLYTNDSSGDDTQTNTLTAFGTAGFTLGDMADVNADGDTYVSWNWDAGTAVTNYTTSDNSADIASTVWKNQTSGLSIVKWESDGASAIKTVNHGLNAAPEFVITKKYSGSGGWVTFHTSFSNQVRDILELNTNGAVATESNDIWSRSNTLLGYRQSNSATDGDDMIAYCWTSIPGYSAFGKYTGNGSAAGPFLYTGFRPRWFMMKEITDASTNWVIYDSERTKHNPVQHRLFPNASTGGNTYDGSSSDLGVDFLSNGFKLRNDNSGINASDDEYIWCAFAEHPFKLARAA